MLNDLVYMLQNSLTTTDLLYENVIKQFDSKVYDIGRLFSELSRISAIAKFADVHDSGITSAFTDRTSELIAEYRTSVGPFSLCSLLESGYDDAQIQMPGFITSFNYHRNDDNSENVDKLQNSSESSLNIDDESTDFVVRRTDVLDVAKLSFSDIKTHNDQSMHNSGDILVNDDATVSIVPTEHRVHDRPNEKTKSSIRSPIVRAKLIEKKPYDPENPDKYDDDYDDLRKIPFRHIDNGSSECAFDNDSSHVKRNEIAKSENSTSFFVNRTESEVRITSYYNMMHHKPKDPFRPDDYYTIPDLCYAMCDKHKNVMIYDIKHYITHLPLSSVSTANQRSIKTLMTMSPLSIKSRVIHVPSPPAIISSFVKLYETSDLENAYLDCYNIRLITKFPDKEFTFSQQHFHALHENFKSYIRKTKTFGLSFQFMDMQTQKEIAENSAKINGKRPYKYVQLIVFTTYHSYVFNKITAVLFTKYDKMSTKSIMVS